MPLHGKIVVIKRSGVDGTEFPLTATCLFGRRPDCDIRIQLPQVSKEHCRIDLNENKEIILTNLSTANPTRVNGEALHQSERLKHGDVITIIDRSFRFEYPPAPTPKKGSIKTETLKVLQDQQVGDTVATETGEKRISEVSTDPLKDGTNHHNIQRSLEKTVEATEDDSLQSKTASPFNDLYQMIKKSLDVKTPRKSSVSVLQTPTSRFCTPKSVRKNDGKPVISTEDKVSPKKDDAKICAESDETKVEAENANNETPKSVKKQRRSFQLPSADMAKPEAEDATKSEATSPQKRIRTPPQRFTACEVIGSKSPVRRRSKEAKPTAEKETFKKRKSEELGADLPTQQAKKKRVSFGGFLCPELFDKRLPPDSPLRKGATPRRSYVSKPKESLLRRASVIGLIKSKKGDPVSPKMKTPSPKSKNASPKTQTSGKTSPKSRSSSPKAATPAKTSPKSRSSSPKAATPAKTSPKSRSSSPKAATPAKASPKSKTPSPARGRSSTVQTPKVQGRFSVSLIGTPSPVAEDAADHVSVACKVPQKRKSTSRETPSKTKSAAKVMRRRSSISRASMRVNSWADIVRFGQTKAQVIAPAKQTISRKTMKKTVTKPQTPARKVKSHVSTGHADSPATIVVGRAHKLVRQTGAAPKLVTNTALFKKNMKMDEDLTGISEMLKTPANERKRSVIHALKTPVGTSVAEPSVLNTPEEPGEMIVSPLSVSSTLKDGSYNSEAVQRFLADEDEEHDFISDTPALEIQSDNTNEQLDTVLKTTSVKTPKQKPEKPDCLTGVKRMMKTPRQKAEPIEDLRGKILKTPKQKPEPQECLTGVKRMMKTPRQKAEPIEDLRGKILKTPKQKPEPQECLTGVKKMMETPRKEAETVDDIKVELLETPTQKREQEEGLATENSICKTPQQEAEPLEDPLEKPLETSTAVEEPAETPAPVQKSPNLSENGDGKYPMVSLVDIKTKMPKERSDPVEDMVGVKRLMKTPKEKGKPVEESFGIKELVETPKPSCNAPVEDMEELQELMEETLAEPTGGQEPTEVADQMSPDCGEDVAKELDFTDKEPQQDVLSGVTDVTEEQPKEDAITETLTEEDAAAETVPEEQPKDDTTAETVPDEQPKDDTTAEKVPDEQPKDDTTAEKVPDEQPKDGTTAEKVPDEQPKDDTTAEKVPDEQPKDDTTAEKVPDEQPKDDTTAEKVPDEQPEEDAAAETLPEEDAGVDRTASALVHEKKSVRGRRVRAVECRPAVEEEEAAEHSEEPVLSAPVRGRRGKKAEAPAPPAVRRATRGRNTKCLENPSDDQPELEPVNTVETPLTETPAAAETEQTSPVKENDSAGEAVVKPARGRKPKQTPVEPQKQEVVSEEPPAEAQPEKSITTVGRPKRGRKTKPDAVEQDEAAVAVETMQQSQPSVRAKRGRNAKQEEESASVETTESQEPAKKTRRTRKVEQDQASGDPAEMIPEVSTETKVVPEPQSEQGCPVDVDHDANDSTAPLEKAVSKPKRGRKAKGAEQLEVTSSHSDHVPQADMAEAPGVHGVTMDQLEVEPSGSNESESSDAMETVPQPPVTESPPKVESATCEVTEMEADVIPKKSVRGRRVRAVECRPAVEEEEAAEHSEEPVLSAPVRGRRGKKTEAPAPPAVRRATRGRNTKCLENPSDDQPELEPVNTVETPLTETPAAAETEQTSVKENDSAGEAVVKPARGRKPKQTPVEPQKQEVVSEEPPAEAQPEKSITTMGRPKRGRKTKPDAVEQEEAAVAVETMQQSQPSVRAKRGRNAKQEEESASVETTESQEPAKKTRRTRKGEQDQVEPREEEVQAAEAVIPEEAEVPLEPVKVITPATAATKPRRGRKPKQAPESENPAVSPEEEVPAVSATDKLKRGRRAKDVAEEVAVAAVPEEDDTEPHAPVAKQSRARGAKAASIPAKRARRCAAPPREKTAESTVLVSEAAPSSVEPAKRGRRAAAKPTAADDAMMTSDDQENPSEDVNGAAAETKKTSQKSVKWNANLQVFDIPTATPVKAARGRKSSKNVSKDADETEEKDLSGNVVEALPTKRAIRGSKVVEAEADAQPKPRRGRPAKK